jgi:hypothetical protein
MIYPPNSEYICSEAGELKSWRKAERKVGVAMGFVERDSEGVLEVHVSSEVGRREFMSAQEREVGMSYRSWIWIRPQKATK